MNDFKVPHRRLNILTGEWVLVSPHRTKRPWQGQTETTNKSSNPKYDENCYLCPGNSRAGGNINPAYDSTFVFKNDFAALLSDTETSSLNVDNLLISKSEKGICKVVCFSPRHDLTLAQLTEPEIIKVIETWQQEYRELGRKEFINYVQIFENKGAVMGCSNPHPHGQIWAEETIPNEPMKECVTQKNYYEKTGRTLLADYLKLELEKKDRIIDENNSFTTLVPFWAIWPFEAIIISKRSISSIDNFSEQEKIDFAKSISVLTKKYDKVFDVSFPYSSGIHQAPTDGQPHLEWHFHMHFYPPLLRSATVKKFMVGYEMMANPQRDITAEDAAKLLREIAI